MNEFTFCCPTKVIFGTNSLTKINDFFFSNTKEVLLLRGRNETSKPVLTTLQQAGLNVIELIALGEPTIDSVNNLYQQICLSSVNVIVSCGGGSVIDTAKVLSLCLSNNKPLDDDFYKHSFDEPIHVRHIAIPTTAGTGSEVTSNAVLGVPSQSAKVSLRGGSIAPYVAIVDPDLLSTIPSSVALFSGMDAVVQLIEAYTSCKATPFTDMLTQSLIPRALSAVRQVVEKPTSYAWSEMALCSLTSGIALSNGGLGAAHGLASVIGGAYTIPHGALCAQFISPVLRQNCAKLEPNSPSITRVMECINFIANEYKPIDANDKLSGFDYWLINHWPTDIKSISTNASELDILAAKAVDASSSQKNPVALKKEDFLQILSSSL